MSTIPKHLKKNWKKGLKAKAAGNKEKAMKHFLGCYDLLMMLNTSYNTNFPESFLQQRTKEVKQEIRLLLNDEEYLQTTIVPEEGIAEIKAAVGMGESENVYRENYTCNIVSDSLYVTNAMKKTLEIEQLTLVDYRKENSLTEGVLKIRLTCEGKTKEFPYDTGIFDQRTLTTIAQQIRHSTGRIFSQFDGPGGDILIQTNYPSIKNLLTMYLPKGGWLTDDEAATLKVIGYPSQDSHFPEVLTGKL